MDHILNHVMLVNDFDLATFFARKYSGHSEEIIEDILRKHLRNVPFVVGVGVKGALKWACPPLLSVSTDKGDEDTSIVILPLRPSLCHDDDFYMFDNYVNRNLPVGSNRMIFYYNDDGSVGVYVGRLV